MNSELQIILFNEHLVSSILSGKKTTTIRFEEDYFLGPAIGRSAQGTEEFSLTVISISKVKLMYGEGGITAETLAEEAFDDLEETGFNRLVSNLKKYYPEIQKGDPVSIVRFKLS
jgi:hypothetical protein